jgi:hypothetical protein
MAKEILNNLLLNCESQSLPAIILPWKNERENVIAPITKKEAPKELLDKQEDTEEVREITEITGGKCFNSNTGIEAKTSSAANETAQHIDKQEISSKPSEQGEMSKEISKNPKSQRKCPKVKNDAFLWI